MPDRWDNELKRAGFTGADTVVYDADQPYQYCAAIVASPQFDSSHAEDRAVTILCEKPEEGITRSLISDLDCAGFSVKTTNLTAGLPSGQDVISTLDLETRFFENISAPDFKAF